jgi:rhodanese-related sulfurtransferase
MTFITLDQLQAKLASAVKPILVEALPEEFYASSHLPNAVNIPKDQVDELAPRLLKDKNADIVVYCAHSECHASTEVAERLVELGYTQVSDFEAGKKGWLEAGLPVEKGVPAAV